MNDGQIITGMITLFIAVIAALLGAWGTYFVEKIRNKQERQATLSALLFTLAHSFVLAFERMVMVYEQVFGQTNQVGLTKTTVYDFSGLTTPSEAIRLTSDPRLIAAIAYLEERYFHVRRQLDNGSRCASDVEAFEHAAQTNEAVLSGLRAQHLIQNAIAFASDAPKCFKEGKSDETFDKITNYTDYILQKAEEHWPCPEMDNLRQTFNDARIKKQAIDEKHKQS